MFQSPLGRPEASGASPATFNMRELGQNLPEEDEATQNWQDEEQENMDRARNQGYKIAESNNGRKDSPITEPFEQMMSQFNELLQRTANDINQRLVNHQSETRARMDQQDTKINAFVHQYEQNISPSPIFPPTQQQPKYLPPSHPDRRTQQPWRSEQQPLQRQQQRLQASSDDDDFQARGNRGKRHPDPTHPPDLPLATKPKVSEFKTSEIGFFHPGLEITKDLPDAPYVEAGKDVIYRNVHLFVQQARRAARTNNTVASNLYRCLRGSAMTWFTSFDENTQMILENDLDEFCKRLETKYKLSCSKAFDKLHASHYTMDDARSLRPADDYIQTMILYGQSCDQSVPAVLILAWKNLDRELQRDVHRPTGDIDVFTKDLEDAIEYWSSAEPSKKPTVRFDSNPRTFTKDEKEAAYQRGIESGRRYNQPQSSQRPQYPQSNPYRNSMPRQDQRLLPPPNQRQITANQAFAEDNGSGDDEQHQNDDAEEVNYANFGDTESYYIDDGPHIYFNDSSEEQHSVPAHACAVCRLTFMDFSELDQHMFSEHAVDTQSSSSKGQKTYANWLEHAAQHIVTISEPPPSRGYATIQARLYTKDGKEVSVCVDTGSAVTFLDKSLLPVGRNLYGILTEVPPITVRGISGERIVSKSIKLEIYLTGINGEVICMNAKAYVTDGIKAGVILGMDELGRPEDDIGLWLGRKLMSIKNTKIPIVFATPGSKPVSFFAELAPNNETSTELSMKPNDGTKKWSNNSILRGTHIGSNISQTLCHIG